MRFEEGGLMNVPETRPHGMLNAGVAWVLMYDTGETDDEGNKNMKKMLGHILTNVSCCLTANEA